MVGRKILIWARDDKALIAELEKLSEEILRGYDYANCQSFKSLRIMRPLRTDEETFYLSAEKLP